MVPKKGLTEREREAGPVEKKPGAVYRDNRRGQHPGGTNKQSEMGDKIGLTGLQISNGTRVHQGKKILGWCWQNHSRHLVGLQYFLGLCVWVFVTTLEFCSQVCRTHTTCLSSLLSCGFSDFTKALSL